MMKKILLFTFGGLLGMQVSAQTINKTELKAHRAGAATKAQLEFSTVSSSSYRTPSMPEASGDTIFYESFGNGLSGDGMNGTWTSDGTYNGGTPYALWEYRGAATTPDLSIGSRGNWNRNRGPIQSPTTSNGFFIFDSDYYDNGGRDAQDNPSPAGSGPYPAAHQGSLVSPVFDLSAYSQDVSIKMNVYWRRFQADAYVMFTTDGGATWTDTLTVFHDADNAVNSASDSNATFVARISNSLLGSSNVQMRIWFDGTDAHGSTFGSGYYFWQIDDVIIMETPDNDLAIGQKFYNGYQDSTSIRHYRSIPNVQAEYDSIFFGAEVTNKGVAAQPNTYLNVSVDMDGTSFWMGNSGTKNLPVAGTDSVEMDNATYFRPNGGIGEYVMNFNVASDSIEANPNDNMSSVIIDVTENLYAWDNDNMNQGNWYTATSDWEMLLAYQINVADTAVAISVLFPDLDNGYGLQPGDALSYYLYNGNDLSSPIAKNEFYIVQSGDEDEFLTLPIPKTNLPVGQYFAGFKVYSTQIGVATNTAANLETPPFLSLVRIDAVSSTDQWSYTTDVFPFIRLITVNPDACDGVTMVIADTVTDNQAIGEIKIGVTGGTPNYTYSWTGPNNYTSSVQNPTDILHQGTYNVVVSDVIGCVGSKDIEVGGIVTVEELNFAGSVNIYPNPNNGEFTVAITGVSGLVNVSVKNVLGQTISNEKVQVNGTLNKTMNNNGLEKGIYFVEVSTDNGAKSVVRFVVE